MSAPTTTATPTPTTASSQPQPAAAASAAAASAAAASAASAAASASPAQHAPALTLSAADLRASARAFAQAGADAGFAEWETTSARCTERHLDRGHLPAFCNLVAVALDTQGQPGVQAQLRWSRSAIVAALEARFRRASLPAGWPLQAPLFPSPALHKDWPEDVIKAATDPDVPLALAVARDGKTAGCPLVMLLAVPDDNIAEFCRVFDGPATIWVDPAAPSLPVVSCTVRLLPVTDTQESARRRITDPELLGAMVIELAHMSRLVLQNRFQLIEANTLKIDLGAQSPDAEAAMTHMLTVAHEENNVNAMAWLAAALPSFGGPAGPQAIPRLGSREFWITRLKELGQPALLIDNPLEEVADANTKWWLDKSSRLPDCKPLIFHDSEAPDVHRDDSGQPQAFSSSESAFSDTLDQLPSLFPPERWASFDMSDWLAVALERRLARSTRKPSNSFLNRLADLVREDLSPEGVASLHGRLEEDLSPEAAASVRGRLDEIEGSVIEAWISLHNCKNEDYLAFWRPNFVLNGSKVLALDPRGEDMPLLHLLFMRLAADTPSLRDFSRLLSRMPPGPIDPSAPFGLLRLVEKIRLQIACAGPRPSSGNVFVGGKTAFPHEFLVGHAVCFLHSLDEWLAKHSNSRSQDEELLADVATLRDWVFGTIMPRLIDVGAQEQGPPVPSPDYLARLVANFDQFSSGHAIIPSPDEVRAVLMAAAMGLLDRLDGSAEAALGQAVVRAAAEHVVRTAGKYCDLATVLAALPADRERLPEIRSMLGFAFLAAVDVPLNALVAAKHFKRAATAGEASGELGLALVYLRGLLGRPDLKRALEQLRLAIAKGEVTAMLVHRHLEAVALADFDPALNMALSVEEPSGWKTLSPFSQCIQAGTRLAALAFEHSPVPADEALTPLEQEPRASALRLFTPAYFGSASCQLVWALKVERSSPDVRFGDSEEMRIGSYINNTNPDYWRWRSSAFLVDAQSRVTLENFAKVGAVDNNQIYASFQPLLTRITLTEITARAKVIGSAFARSAELTEEQLQALEDSLETSRSEGLMHVVLGLVSNEALFDALVHHAKTTAAESKSHLLKERLLTYVAAARHVLGLPEPKFLAPAREGDESMVGDGGKKKKKKKKKAAAVAAAATAPPPGEIRDASDASDAEKQAAVAAAGAAEKMAAGTGNGKGNADSSDKKTAATATTAATAAATAVAPAAEKGRAGVEAMFARLNLGSKYDELLDRCGFEQVEDFPLFTAEELVLEGFDPQDAEAILVDVERRGKGPLTAAGTSAGGDGDASSLGKKKKKKKKK